jgi:hypothetical protein
MNVRIVKIGQLKKYKTGEHILLVAVPPQALDKALEFKNFDKLSNRLTLGLLNLKLPDLELPDLELPDSTQSLQIS